MIDHITILYGGWYGPPSDCDEAMPYEIELDEELAALAEKALRNGDDVASVPEIAELIDDAVAELKDEKIDILKSNEDSYTMECLGYEWDDEAEEWVYMHDDDPDFEPSDPFDGGYRFIADVDEDELWEQLGDDEEDEDEEDDEEDEDEDL